MNCLLSRSIGTFSFIFISFYSFILRNTNTLKWIVIKYQSGCRPTNYKCFTRYIGMVTIIDRNDLVSDNVRVLISVPSLFTKWFTEDEGTRRMSARSLGNGPTICRCLATTSTDAAFARWVYLSTYCWYCLDNN